VIQPPPTTGYGTIWGFLPKMMVEQVKSPDYRGSHHYLHEASKGELNFAVAEQLKELLINP
jgi:hypothetical protein